LREESSNEDEKGERRVDDKTKKAGSQDERASKRVINQKDEAQSATNEPVNSIMTM